MPTDAQTDKAQTARSVLLRQSIFLFGLSMIAVLWLALGWKLHTERAAEDARISSDTANLARAFEESVLRTMQQVDLRLQVLRGQIAQSPNPATWHRFVLSVPLDNEISFQLAVTDAKGVMVTSSLDLRPGKPVDLSDREHIRVQIKSSSDDLFISRPLLGRVSKQWSINITRAIRGYEGELLGVAVASLSPAYLTRFYDSIDLGERGSVLMMGADGYVRAGTGGFDLANANIQESDLFRAMRAGAEGHYTGPVVQSQSAVTAWRKVRGLPLYVAVAVDKPSARATEVRSELAEMAAAGFLTLLIALATTFIERSQHKVHLARVQIAATAAQINAKSAELEAMLDNISQGILMVDRGGGLLVANRRALELLGKASLAELSEGVGGLLAEVQKLHKTTERPDRAGSVRVHLTRGEDRILEVAQSSAPEGKTVLTITDVTLVERRQHELETAWHAANAANRAKTQFLSTMSHEMRTPLNGMIGALDILARTRLDTEQTQFVETALSSGEALLVHINDVLDFSKMEAGKLVLEPAPFSLAHLTDTVLKIVAPQAEVRGNVLARDIGGDVPAWVLGDPIRIRQILLNLVGNAAKFTRNGRVLVRVQRTGGSAERPELLVSIEDTGVGIPQDRMDNLFLEFSMIDASLSRKEGGTGLGLAICKRLVQAMGGEIGVDSRIGEGSRFWFRVPLDRAEEPAAEEKVSAQDESAVGVPLNILLVDDNLTNQLVASRMLAAAGHMVVTASDGLEALQAASKKRYDVILMDISMPEMDGIEATKRIRKLRAPFASVPIIALTANAVAGDRERFLAAGMNDYLTKPIRRATIEARLAKLARELGLADGVAMAPQPVVEDGAPAQEVVLLDEGELERLAAETTPEVVPLVVEQFIGEAAVRMQEIAVARGSRDLAALGKAAHALAGASASVGGLRLRHATKAIELACQSEQGTAALDGADALPAIAMATSAALTAFIETFRKQQPVSAAA